MASDYLADGTRRLQEPGGARPVGADEDDPFLRVMKMEVWK